MTSSFSSLYRRCRVVYITVVYIDIRVLFSENSYHTTRRNIGGIVSLDESNLMVLKLTILRKGSCSCRSTVMYTKFRSPMAKRPYSINLFSGSYRKSTSALIRRPLTKSIFLLYPVTLLARAFTFQVAYRFLPRISPLVIVKA